MTCDHDFGSLDYFDTRLCHKVSAGVCHTGSILDPFRSVQVHPVLDWWTIMNVACGLDSTEHVNVTLLAVASTVTSSEQG